MRLRRLGLVLVVGAAVAALAVSASHAPPAALSSPSIYLDEALGLIQRHAVGGQRPIDWTRVVAQAHRLAAGATRTSDTYPAISHVVDAVRASGDPHAMFFTASEWKAYLRSYRSYPLGLPSVAARGRLGIISLREIAATPVSPDARRYERAALSGIELVRKTRPCGWIVDLRYDGGGDMFPMLLSVGPIIGEGNLLGFASRKRFKYFVAYRSGAVAGGGYVFKPPLRVPVIRPASPVAVLIGSGTVSAGEAVAIAFRGRPNTRFFGSPTAGATNVPQVFKLSDGAVIWFGVMRELDRNRTTYKGPITPDISTNEGSPTRAEHAATRWLLDQQACLAH